MKSSQRQRSFSPKALANIINSENVANEGFVIGYDRRFLSDKAAKWFAEVLAGNRITVSFIDKFVPTPVVMYKGKTARLCLLSLGAYCLSQPC